MLVVSLWIKTPEKGSEGAPGRQRVVERQSMSLSVFKMLVGEIPNISQISNRSHSPNFEAPPPVASVPRSDCRGNWRGSSQKD